jgi:hypothetical protein
LSTLREDLEDLVNRWAVGGNGIDAASRDLISACSAELLRVLDKHPEAPDDEYRITPKGEQAADAARYALVEQMGHRATVAAVRETTFCGAPMLEVTDLKTGSVHLAAPQSLYEITWLTEDEARRRAKPWTAVALPAAADSDPWPADDEDDESAREMAEEGNATAMSAAERDQYERDGEAWLDAQDEADADEEREIQRLERDVDSDDFDEDGE